MVTLMVMEFENSAATYREMAMVQAYHLASNGNNRSDYCRRRNNGQI